MKQQTFQFEQAEAEFDDHLKRYRVYLAVLGEIEVWAYTRRQAILVAESEHKTDLVVRALKADQRAPKEPSEKHEVPLQPRKFGEAARILPKITRPVELPVGPEEPERGAARVFGDTQRPGGEPARLKPAIFPVCRMRDREVKGSPYGVTLLDT